MRKNINRFTLMITSILFFLIPFTFSYSFDEFYDFLQLADPDQKVNCNYIERYRVCPNNYEPVCSSYPGVCVSPSCENQDFPNGCVACQDPTITAYTLGTCIIGASDNGLSAGLNHDIAPAEVTEIELGELEVTEITEGAENEFPEEEFPGELPGEEEEEEDVEQTVEEPEEPEENEEQTEEKPEEVPEENLPLRDSFYVVVFCDEERPVECYDDYNPVCIVGCVNGACIKTADNVCKACRDPNVLSYSLERCEKERKYCPANPVNVPPENACLSLFDPVCAYARGCVGNNCGRTVTNSCEACYVNNAEYFTLGPC